MLTLLIITFDRNIALMQGLWHWKKHCFASLKVDSTFCWGPWPPSRRLPLASFWRLIFGTVINTMVIIIIMRIIRVVFFSLIFNFLYCCSPFWELPWWNSIVTFSISLQSIFTFFPLVSFLYLLLYYLSLCIEIIHHLYV